MRQQLPLRGFQQCFCFLCWQRPWLHGTIHNKTWQWSDHSGRSRVPNWRLILSHFLWLSMGNQRCPTRFFRMSRTPGIPHGRTYATSLRLRWTGLRTVLKIVEITELTTWWDTRSPVLLPAAKVVILPAKAKRNVLQIQSCHFSEICKIQVPSASLLSLLSYSWECGKKIHPRCHIPDLPRIPAI